MTSSSANTTSVCSLHLGTHQTSIRNFFANRVQPAKRRTPPPGRPGTRKKFDPAAGSHKKIRSPNPIAPPHSVLACNNTTRSTKKRFSTASSRRHHGCSSPDDNNVVPEQRKVATKKTTQQLYLDLGQRNFAKPIECAVCGMLFVHGLSEDAKRHASICKDYQQGVTFAALDNLRVAQTMMMLHKKHGQTSAATSKSVTIVEVRGSLSFESGVIDLVLQHFPLHDLLFFIIISFSSVPVKIRPSDSYALRKKVTQIKVIVDQELGFAENGSSAGANNRTAFLAIANKRTIGMVLVETIDTAYQLLLSPSSSETGDEDKQDSSSILERSHVRRRAVMGIHQIWVHSKFRSQGIASALVDTARSHLVFGYTIPAQQVAFSSPTESGVRFARRYMRARVPPPSPSQRGGKNNNCRSVQRTRHDDQSIETPGVLVYDCC